MQPLEKSLRNNLEKTIREARDFAEEAARVALEQLGVGESKAYPHLSDDDRKLRRRLRAHGRQLGDGRNAKGEQGIDRLIEEVAYEHWHRMLFARFLAENNLLMYPDPDDPVAITLEECEDLAADEDAANGWELAARFAARMLPQIFRLDSPVFQLELPPEHQQKLERLVADLALEVFIASDSLGWVYQFWQVKKKDEVNASEVKIGARELHAVTQLFTEPYMVSFLLDNSLGAWWAKHKLSEEDLRNAKTEEDLRRKVAIQGVPLDYLRFIRQKDSTWSPATDTFERWPENLSELKIIDPCCGSGHFLVAAFHMLVPMRMELENLSAHDAIDSVLKHNLIGLEVDSRCVELAAFSLALSAWTYLGASNFRPLPKLNVACSGLSISAKREEWLNLVGDNTNIRLTMEKTYELFKNAPVLGSLINPKSEVLNESLFDMDWEHLEPLLAHTSAGNKDDEKKELSVVARGISSATRLLNGQYHLVITNVPYLSRNKQDETLRKYCERNYKDAKNDLSTVFLERCIEYANDNGTIAIVIPHNWMFLTSYKNLRKKLLRRCTWNIIGRLGFAAFEIMDWWAFDTSLIIKSKRKANNDSKIIGIDASESRQCETKAHYLRTEPIKCVGQANQLNNPDARVMLDIENTGKLVEYYASSRTGLQTGDNDRFSFLFWEFMKIDNPWVSFQRTADETDFFKGMYQVLRWNGDGKELRDQKGSALRGLDCCGRSGVLVHRMNRLPVTLYSGEIFDQNGAVIIPKKKEYFLPLWCYLSSDDYYTEVRKLDSKVGVTPATLAKVQFNYDYWEKISQEKFPNGLPEPYSDDPTQWIFHGHPAISGEPLHVAVARLLGYRWPAEFNPKIRLSDKAKLLVEESKLLTAKADGDGIVCIPPVRGEMKVVDRLEEMLAAAYGSKWSAIMRAELLSKAEHSGKSLETWIRDKFFIQHCRLFHQRPFIWHIWDGLSDGFAALINYHKLNFKLLETLIYTYLGDWISRQKRDIENGVDGAHEKLAAAESLKKKLELILDGEAPHDVYVRWKPLENQPIGWNPDLNDGVRRNIRPFMTVGDVKKKGAGVLRDKPNIKWGKDRGKDASSAPWYHLFKGDRINDHHLTLKEKQEAQKNRK
ncbi:hypothetical protein DSCOOX_06810 [Desulfosarcina ovata subsp. ovata]|uniref:site-specific DNA-methyltransferase (adenine-specific) n=2 Tax=Desulfosarcina ovata TaxID=83564 RepID=A0A5K8A4U1_9BACT|nr:hypothetical protein DSCOOX_06810 [Desulfosarcina ovata subsp. ovata]